MHNTGPLALARTLFPPGTPLHPGDLLPDQPGAYLLLIRLDAPVPFARQGNALTVPAGWHAYAGNARGPGGMAARLRHHFRADKRPHWHVDALTTKAAALIALALPGGNECAIIARLLASERFTLAFPGFGSSDCRTCPAHLLRFLPGPAETLSASR